MATKKLGSLKRSSTILITSVDLTADVGSTILPVANGGTGQGSYTNGQLLIGNTTGNTLTKTTLTGTANQVVVTNGAGSITLSTPQDIGTSSAVQFGSVLIYGAGSGILGVANPTITNDTSVALITMQGGADVTLGPLSFIFGAHPSATGANRYGYFGVTDNTSVRPFALNSNGSGIFGTVMIGSNAIPTGAIATLVFGNASTAMGSATADMVNMGGIDTAAGDCRLAIQTEAGSRITVGNDRINYSASTGLISINSTDVVTITAGNLKTGGASTGSADTRLTLGGSGNGGSGRGSAILIRGPGSSSEVDLVKLNAFTTGGATASQSADYVIQTAVSGTLTEAIRINPSSITIPDASNLVVGSTTGTKIATATTQKLGFYNATPIAQRSGAAQAAVATTASTTTTPFGYTTQAQADAIVTLVNELRAWAVAQGFIKGSA